MKRNKRTHIIEHSVPLIKQKTIVGYKKRYRLMNNTESALFSELQRGLPQNYHIFPNMRLADVVDAINNGDYFEFKKRNHKIMPRHIDFIVCDQNFKPNVAVELNGGYHKRNSQVEKDEEKRQILEEAGLPFVVVKVGDSFVDSVEKIKSLL